MKRILIGLMLCVVLTPAVAYAAPSITAEDALRTQMELLSTGQYGRLWKQLHPAQKAVIDKAAYVECGAKTLAGAEITDVDIGDTYTERITIPGTDVKTKAVALVTKYTVAQGLLKNTHTFTFHEIKDGKRWLFVVANPDASTDC